jgi:hypothetical protein
MKGKSLDLNTKLEITYLYEVGTYQKVKHDNGMDLTSSAMFTTLKKRIYNIYY